MSDEQIIQKRIGGLEQRQARTEERIEHIESAVNETKEGVRMLLDRDARRPEPANWRTVLLTLASVIALMGSIGGMVWWFIEHSPAVTSVTRRVYDLDNPRTGRVTTLEGKVKVLGGWRPRVTVRHRAVPGS